MHTSNTVLKSLYLVAAVSITAALLFSCENNIETINTLTAKDNSPFEISKNIKLIYSENSKILVQLKTPLLERYLGERPYMEMPKGVEVFFYDSLMHVTSHLKANYAISYENEKITEARNNVIVVNEKHEQLNTECLFWDEKKAIIYSDVFVKITTPDEVLFGEGFESDERFDKWIIRKPKGSFTIKEDNVKEKPVR
ncbi:MAG: Lipopolysaccharide-assembly, LptC-related [Bacteroidetes bacterium ADurb.Bin408]|nr:MAG: Lipopolysaccharide-assembly, LptC-related [Bacteroidetes bacterium ADurb.Bin408]